MIEVTVYPTDIPGLVDIRLSNGREFRDVTRFQANQIVEEARFVAGDAGVSIADVAAQLIR